MPRVRDIYDLPSELVLGKRLNTSVPEPDQKRQLTEVKFILERLRHQPGIILADEVGMGKTFVALAVAYSIGVRSPRGPVIVMVPPNLIDKWEQDLKTFCELYIEDLTPVRKDQAKSNAASKTTSFRYGVARNGVELMKLVDDPPRDRCHLIFLPHGAMARRQSDKWIRLALIAEALRRHGRGQASRLIQVKDVIHRFMAELLWAIGEQKSHDWGENLWKTLLKNHTSEWKRIYNDFVTDEKRKLLDDPVPKSVTRVLERIDLSPLAEALKQMPVRARGGDTRVTARLNEARKALRNVEGELWKDVLAQTRWRSPLLMMDEAHHLKNPGTLLARQLQSPVLQQDLRTGDGAMANAFDRMLFLTATPFQMGHHELLSVLGRFGDVRWERSELGPPEEFSHSLKGLGQRLDDSQRAAIALQKSWSRLRTEDTDGDIEAWWRRLIELSGDDLNNRQRAVVDSFQAAKKSRDLAQSSLQSWIVRHNKGTHWSGTTIQRRQRLEGSAMMGAEGIGGIKVPADQLLPFFLAARSNLDPGKDLLGEALCSSYEAFRTTRQVDSHIKDEQEGAPTDNDISHTNWYLDEFDGILREYSGSKHPKMHATVKKTVDLWEAGEKVLVFGFYRRTCQALRRHISDEIERRIMTAGQRLLREAGQKSTQEHLDKLLERIQKRYFDDTDSPGRRALDTAIDEIIHARKSFLDKAKVTPEERELLRDIMRRFLRVSTTLIRCFPITDLESIAPDEAVDRTLNYSDGSGMSWLRKFDDFIEFLTERCSTAERAHFLEASSRMQTGFIRVGNDDETGEGEESALALANVKVATGTTKPDARSRLMRSFNTPFFPDILVCSQVMGEGVDLQRFCRHVIHHDLAWNPSTIEQRTGRIDRLGCKAEGRHPIAIYLPYLAGTADERQFQVMSDREKWFRVVMGQDEVESLIRADRDRTVPLPDAIADALSFRLDLTALRNE